MSLRNNVLILCLTALGLLSLTTAPARAQHPAYGAGIVVDGNAADWDLDQDFFADMYRAGQPDPDWYAYEVLSTLYLRYDCDAQVLSALVLDATGDLPMPNGNPAGAWIKFHGLGWPDDLLVDGAGGGNTTPRAFQWVRDIPGDILSPIIGFEACARMDEGDFASFEARLTMDDTFASTGRHDPGFDAVAFDDHLEGLNQPGTIRIRVSYPYNGGPAYFPTTDIDFDGDGTADLTTTSWCIDTDHTISNNSWYCTTLISSFSYPEGLDDTRRENLDVVNWILNQNFVGQSSGAFGNYTYGDVQFAIWSVIDNSVSANGLGPYNMSRVNQILAGAMLAVGLNDPAVGYEPPCDGVVGLILVPTDCGPNYGQFLIAQMLVSQVPAICTSFDTALGLHCGTGTVDADGQPAGLVLEPAFPNPFNPATLLTFRLPESGHATLKIYDLAGREVATLLDGLASAGKQSFHFQAGRLPSGVYMAVLRAGTLTATQKLLLVK